MFDIESCVNKCIGDNDDEPCAVISDIHSNLLALEAVLEDILNQGIERICCLGDVVGYGPQPIECWRLIKKYCSVRIRGNHDQALSLEGITRFHPRARTAIEWALSVIRQEEDGEEIINTLSSLPLQFSCRGRLHVHASPTGPTMDYLLPRDAYDEDRMKREFSLIDICAFNGHTHIPGVIEKGSGSFILPEALDEYTYVIGDKPAIINVGSVGQPRDGNSKSCYVVITGNSVRYRRVEYDAAGTCRQILSIPELDPFLGYRLLEGR